MNLGLQLFYVRHKYLLAGLCSTVRMHPSGVLSRTLFPGKVLGPRSLCTMRNKFCNGYSSPGWREGDRMPRQRW